MKIPKLLPCPFCGNTATNSIAVPIGYRVRCQTCDAYGPNHVRLEDAAASWNSRIWGETRKTVFGDERDRVKDYTRIPPGFSQHGVYRIFWKDPEGGCSVGAIGSTKTGQLWYAPSNWVDPVIDPLTWMKVERVELIASQHGGPMPWMPTKPPEVQRADIVILEQRNRDLVERLNALEMFVHRMSSVLHERVKHVDEAKKVDPPYPGWGKESQADV